MSKTLTLKWINWLCHTINMSAPAFFVRDDQENLNLMVFLLQGVSDDIVRTFISAAGAFILTLMLSRKSVFDI